MSVGKADQLGRLEEVKDIRAVWPDEARNFTTWLAKPENLSILGDAIGLALEEPKTEFMVGPYRADLVCRDDRDRRVIIENQLEKTDHRHLGQLLTYAVHINASTIVWIAKEFTDEHRATLEWLNQHTDDGVEFFAIEIQLWKIGDSPIAPRFNVTCKPNSWTRVAKPDAASGAAGAKHLRFWNLFNDRVANSSKPIRTLKPSTSHWTDVAVGLAGLHISLLNRWGRDSICQIVLSGPSKAEMYRLLSNSHRDLVAGVLAPFGEIAWREMPERKSAIIQVSRATPPDDESSWPAVIDWFQDTTNAILERLKPTLLVLRADVSLPTDVDVIETDDGGSDSERQARS